MKASKLAHASRIAVCAGIMTTMAAPARAQTAPATPVPADQAPAAQDPAAPQVQPATPPTQSTGDEGGIADIIVTATRRETSLQKTPQAISVLRGEAQFARGQTRLDDIKLSVPNVNFSSTSNQSQLYIRGVGNSFINAGGDPGVALYQDGAYLSDQTVTNTNFFDVDRVEVLRGPQGALYGRNATGGAIIILSAQPTPEFSGKISGTLGDYGRRETEGFLSGPLGFGDTDFRLSYQVKHLNGYIKNQLADQPGAPKRLDDLDSQAVRGQTLTHLSGGGTLRAMFSYFREEDSGDALAVTPTPGVAYAVETLYGAVPSADPFSVKANIGLNRIEVYNGNLDYEQPIGRNNLSITANYRRGKESFANDCDGTEINNCIYLRSNTSDDYYGDAHFAGPTDSRLRVLVGATYLHYKIDQLNNVVYPFPLSYVVPGGPNNVPFPIQVFSGGRLFTEGYAFYTDLRFRLSDIWSISGQARYSHTNKDAHEILRIDSFGINIPDSRIGLTTKKVPYKVGVEGQLTPNILVYANYATAFKDGAINLGATQATTIRPESVKNIELGFKTSLLDRRVQVNGAVFHNRYEDLQISKLLGTVVALTNVPKSKVDGAELEINAAPYKGVNLRLSAGYLDAKLEEFTNTRIIPGAVGGATLDLSGRQLPYAAKWTVDLGADYKFAPVDGYEATIGGTASYRSRIFFTEFNDDYNSQPATTQFDASASFGPAGQGWRVFGFVRNITDRTVRTGSTTYSGLIGAARGVSYSPPRNFGAGVSFTF